MRVGEEISRNTAQEIIGKIETHDLKKEARKSEKSENKPYQKIKRSIVDDGINKYTNKKYSPGNHGHSARNKLPLQNMTKSEDRRPTRQKRGRNEVSVKIWFGYG